MRSSRKIWNLIRVNSRLSYGSFFMSFTGSRASGRINKRLRKSRNMFYLFSCVVSNLTHARNSCFHNLPRPVSPRNCTNNFCRFALFVKIRDMTISECIREMILHHLPCSRASNPISWTHVPACKRSLACSQSSNHTSAAHLHSTSMELCGHSF